MTARLIAAVQTCRRQVPALADDSTWRAFLQRVTGAESLRAMDGRQLGRVLDELHKAGAPRKAGASAAKADAPRASGATLDDRPQMRKARALWIELAKAGAVRDRSEAALLAFARRATGKDRIEWCTPADLNRLIEALKDWRDRADANDPVVKLAATLEIHPCETRDQALVRALWHALGDAGALRAGAHARLDTWLARHHGVSNVASLPQEAAEAAVRSLGNWLRKALRGAPEAARDA